MSRAPRDRRPVGSGVFFTLPATRINGLVDVGCLDVDLLGLGRLDLERFVDQVAKHLLAQRGRPPPAESGCRWRSPASARRWSTSVWVMTSPLTIAVALIDRGHGRAEHLRILRQVERVARCRAVRPAAACGLLRQRASCRPPARGSGRSLMRASNDVEKLLPRSRFPLIPSPMRRLPL